MSTEPATISWDDLAYVRLLIADTADDPILSDDELQIIMGRTMHPLLAAADALDIIATSEVLLGKKITTQDLSVDAPATAAELRKQAAALRKRVADQTAEGAWGIATWTPAAADTRYGIEGVESPYSRRPLW